MMSATNSGKSTIGPNIPAIVLPLFAVAVIGCALLTNADGSFLPDKSIENWGLVASAGFTFLAVAFWVQRLKKSERGLTPGLTLMFVLVWLGGTLAGYGYILGIPNIYTQLFGRAAVVQVTAISWQPLRGHGGSRTCAGVDTALGHICLGRQVAPGTVLTLHGRASIFGFHVDAIG